MDLTPKKDRDRLMIGDLGLECQQEVKRSEAAPDRACDKTSDRLFSKLVLERAPSNDNFVH